MDIFRKRSPAEAAAELRAARAAFDRVPPQHQHLIAASDEDFLSGIEENTPLVETKVEHARQLTSAELAKQRGEVTFLRIMGDTFENIVVDPVGLATEFEKDVDRARAARNPIEITIAEMVRTAVAKLAKSVPGRESDRQGIGILPRLAAAAMEQDAASGLAKFLTAYVGGDERTMRGVARELAS